MNRKFFLTALSVAAAAGFSSCADKSANRIPLGNWEKEASLVAGPTKTPEHSLPKTEYPFDEAGNYMASWARSGESRFGKAHSTWASIISIDVEVDEAALAAEITKKPGH